VKNEPKTSLQHLSQQVSAVETCRTILKMDLDLCIFLPHDLCSGTVATKALVLRIYLLQKVIKGIKSKIHHEEAGGHFEQRL
jgi:hypothetical protein